MAKVTDCKCKHTAQDKIYGNGQRVFNETAKKAGDGYVNIRCTVCGSEKEVKR